MSLTLSSGSMAVGGAGALAFGQPLRGFVHGVPPYDVPAMVAVMILLLAVTVAAALVPAIRASPVDPMAALRVD